MSGLRASLLVVAVAVASLAAPSVSAEPEADAPVDEGFPEAARRPRLPAPTPIHLSAGGGVFQPWDGDRGFNVNASAHVGVGSDRFWIGGEVEYRRYEAEFKRDYQPDSNTAAFRFSFQYHPFPWWPVSPYVGIQTGFAFHIVSDQEDDAGDSVRNEGSIGFSLVGLAGVEFPLFSDRLHLYIEGRVDNTSDIWKRKGGNYQVDQVGGYSGMSGLRMRF